MIINEITITAEASKAYQKYCVALTAQDLNDGDIDCLKRMAITEALKGINELAGNIEGKPDVKVNSQPRQPSYRTDNNYRPTQAPIQQQAPVQNPYPQLASNIVHKGFAYKLCTNNQTGERFYALTNPDDVNSGAKKYVKLNELGV